MNSAANGNSGDGGGGSSDSMTAATLNTTNGPVAAPSSTNPITLAGIPGRAGIVYDISSLDPLQAHALQLTASAGLAQGFLTGQAPNTNNGGTIQSQIAAAPTNSYTPGVAPSTVGQSQVQQPQHITQQQHLFLFQQQAPQQQQQPQGTLSNGGNGVAPVALAATAHPPAPTQQPSAHHLIAPAGATNPPSLLLPAVAAVGGPHAALAATLASQAGGYAQLLAAQGLLPQQYIDFANSAAASTAAPTQPSLSTTQSFVPLAAASVSQNSNNKRQMEQLGSVANAPKKPKQFPPSIISSSTNNIHLQGMNTMPTPAPTTAINSAPIAGTDLLPPKEASEEDLARMTPAERRRYERNLREQQRSYRISQQIKELRDILVDSKFPFKPNKYSILLSVVDYIKQLQSRAIMLDSEHSKLIKTIRETNDMVNTGTAPTSTDESVNAASTADSGSESDMLFVKGIDYRSVFDQCPAALGIAALDGRILECNVEFQTILGFPRQEEVLKQSLFNLVQNHQDIFRAMAQMLKTAEEPLLDSQSKVSNNAFAGGIGERNSAASGAGTAIVPLDGGVAPVESVAISNDRFWTGPVTSKLNVKVRQCPRLFCFRIKRSLFLTAYWSLFQLVVTAFDEHYTDCR
jgi:PAS domain-containing protein